MSLEKSVIPFKNGNPLNVIEIRTSDKWLDKMIHRRFIDITT